MARIGMIGMGVVGGTTAKVFSRIHEILPYDRYKSPNNTPAQMDALAKAADYVFLCVPTPMKPSGQMDYSAVDNSLDLLTQASKRTGRILEDMIVVVRSTAVSGTTDSLETRYPFKFAFNPEFLTEKNALQDMLSTDRVVIGSNSPEVARKIADQVYKPLFPDARYVLTDAKTAEMIKYSANIMLAGQIAVANDLFQVSQRLGVDWDKVKDAILLDPRIGRNINVPGPDGDLGFGGKCFPKDLLAMIYLARENGYWPPVLEAAWNLNLQVRKNKDWLDIPGATSGNNQFEG